MELNNNKVIRLLSILFILGSLISSACIEARVLKAEEGELVRDGIAMQSFPRGHGTGSDHSSCTYGPSKSMDSCPSPRTGKSGREATVLEAAKVTVREGTSMQPLIKGTPRSSNHTTCTYGSSQSGSGRTCPPAP